MENKMKTKTDGQSGLALMAACGYNTEYLLEADAEAFWLNALRHGISSPRKPMENFAEALRKKRTQSKSDLSR